MFSTGIDQHKRDSIAPPATATPRSQPHDHTPRKIPTTAMSAPTPLATNRSPLYVASEKAAGALDEVNDRRRKKRC